MASGAVIVLTLLVLFLVHEAAPALTFSSLASSSWLPSEGKFGLLPMVVASLLSASGALTVAVPLGLGSAIYIRFYASRPVVALAKPSLALLAGVPSVIFGLWGLTTIVPLVAQWKAPGTSLFVATLVLALMIVPTIALTSLAALEEVPLHWLHSANALGLSRRAIAVGIAIPAARSGIRSGIALGAGRALGETMAVLMVAGNVVQMPDSVFAPVRLLTANIALEMAYAVERHRAALFASGLLLALLVLGLTWLGSDRHQQTHHGI